MRYLNKAYSKVRIDSYREWVKDPNNEEQIKELYWLNQEVSAFMFIIVSNFEVLFRNCIHNFFKRRYKKEDWYNEDYFKQQYLYLDKEIQSITTKTLKNQKKAKKYNYIVHADLIISELTFGAWKDILKYADIGVKSELLKELNINNNYVKNIESIVALRNSYSHNQNILKDINLLIANYRNTLFLCKKLGGVQYFQELKNRIASFYREDDITKVYNKLLTKISEIRK